MIDSPEAEHGGRIGAVPDTAAQRLDSFEPISLGEMDRVSLMNRVDTKYAFALEYLPSLLDEVADTYRVLEVAQRRQAAYETLYFDTPGRDCFRDHHRGKPRRYKFRMRRYVSSEAAFFEIKQKDNRGRTLKRRVPIDAIEPTPCPSAARLAAECFGRPVELCPTLWTHFGRITLVARGATERVTLDTGLTFRRKGTEDGFPGVVIAEVKQERDSRSSAIRQRLRCRGVRPMRVSKYCLGMSLLAPSLKSNQFKAKILQLRKHG